MTNIPYIFRAIPPEFLTDDFIEDPAMMRFIRHLFSEISPLPQQKTIKERKLVLELEPFEFIFGREKWAEKTGLSPKMIQNRMGQLVALNFCIKVSTKTVSTFTVYKLNTEAFAKNKGQHPPKKDELFEIRGQHSGQQSGQHFFEKKGQHPKSLLSQKESTTYNQELMIKNHKKGQHFFEKKDQQSGQQSGHNERTKNEEYSLKKETNKEKKSESIDLRSSLLNREEFQAIAAYAAFKKWDISEKTLLRWHKNNDMPFLMETFKLCAFANEKSPKKNLEAYIENALKGKYVIHKINVFKNKELVEDFKAKKRMWDLHITEKYATDNRSQKDFQFKQESEQLLRQLQECYENFYANAI